MVDMIEANAKYPEESLDPQNWDAVRALGHRMVDNMLDYMIALRQEPVWQHAPERVKDHFKAPLPDEPQSLEAIYEEFLEYILPYSVGNNHPRFWGWLFGISPWVVSSSSR